LAGPDSVLSLPASGGKEDHNANSLTAANHAFKLLKNLSHILAVELFCAAQAIDIRKISDPDLVLGIGVQKAYSKIRSIVQYHPQDTWWGPEIDKIKMEIWETGIIA
jgi:histidine ammonia-lyase